MSVSDTGLSCKIAICMQMCGDMYQPLNLGQMAACTNINMVSDTQELTVSVVSFVVYLKHLFGNLTYLKGLAAAR